MICSYFLQKKCNLTYLFWKSYAGWKFVLFISNLNTFQFSFFLMKYFVLVIVGKNKCCSLRILLSFWYFFFFSKTVLVDSFFATDRSSCWWFWSESIWYRYKHCKRKEQVTTRKSQQNKKVCEWYLYHTYAKQPPYTYMKGE